MSRRAKQTDNQPRVTIDGEVARQIRQHARSNSKTEVCGVLIGDDRNGGLSIEASIAGVNAAQAGTHVTFTQDTWEHIYKVKDAKYPESRIVGWYHSHPGFGVFLSDHDTFIHKNFFSSPLQVAWVYDPHSDEEGCFGWVGSRLERLSQISITDEKGGEGAGETGKPEPVGMQDEDGFGDHEETVAGDEKPEEDPLWLRISVTGLSYVLVLVVGFMVSWMFFPRKAVFIVDPQTGFVYEPSADGKHLEFVPEIRVAPESLRAPSQPAPPGTSVPALDPSIGSKAPDAGKAGGGAPAKDPSSSKEPHAPRQ